jgi:hypothetical protein
MGITVVKKINEKFPLKLHHWIENVKALQIAYPDQTEELIHQIFTNKVHLKKLRSNKKRKSLLHRILS